MRQFKTIDIARGISYLRLPVIFSCLTVLIILFVAPSYAKLSSSNKTELIRRGAVHISKQEYEKAIPFFQKVLKEEPKNQKALQGLVICYFQLGVKAFKEGKLDKSEVYFKKVIQLEPENLNAYQNLSLTLLKQKKLEEAKIIIEKGLKVDHTSKPLLLMLAMVYQEQKDSQKLLQTMEELYKFYPEDTEIASNLAQLYESMMKYEDARKIYRQILNYTANKVEIHQKLAQTYLREKNLPAALQEYQELTKIAPNNQEAYQEIAKIYEKLGNPEQAIATYNKLIAIAPNQPEAYVYLGELLEKEESFESAFPEYTKAVELGTSNPLPYYKLALHFEKEKDMQKMATYDKLVIEKGLKEIDNLEASLLVQLKKGGGEVNLYQLVELGEIGEKMQSVKDILRQALDHYLFTYGSKIGVEPEVELKSFLRRHPNSKDLIEYLANWYNSEGRWNESVVLWEQLLKLDVQVKAAHLGLAKAYEKLGREEEAILAYKRTLAIDDKQKDAYEGLIRLYGSRKELSKLIQEWQIKAKLWSQRENVVLLTYLANLLEKEGRETDAKAIRERIETIKIKTKLSAQTTS